MGILTSPCYLTTIMVWLWWHISFDADEIITKPNNVGASTYSQQYISAIKSPIFCNSLALSAVAIYWPILSIMLLFWLTKEVRSRPRLKNVLVPVWKFNWEFHFIARGSMETLRFSDASKFALIIVPSLEFNWEEFELPLLPLLWGCLIG